MIPKSGNRFSTDFDERHRHHHRCEIDGRPRPVRPRHAVRAAAAADRPLRRDRLAAENLFSGPLNIALTIICALLLVWIVPPLVKFLVIDAVWDGAGRADCLPRPDQPRGRRLLGVRERAARLLHLRLLSDRRALAGRCVLRAARVRHRLDGLARRAAPRSRRDLFLRRHADRLAHPAARLSRRSGCRGSRPRSGAAFW